MDVDASYRYCSRLARRSASSFYWSFWLLPRAKRRAMCALYAFSRRADDLSDNELSAHERRQDLRAWRSALENALQGKCDDPLLPALVDTVERFEIPPRHLFDILDGVEMDLEPRRYETFADLREYCLRVASAVGLACIHVWGYSGQQAYEPAVACGVAFQLTNILRDLNEDARRDRLYLPLEDLRRFGYHEQELRAGVCDERFRGLMALEIDRAEQFYRQSAPLFELLSNDGRRVLGMMSATYWRLLQKIKCREGDVFSRRVRLDFGDKLALAARHLLRRSLPPPEFLRDADD